MPVFPAVTPANGEPWKMAAAVPLSPPTTFFSPERTASSVGVFHGSGCLAGGLVGPRFQGGMLGRGSSVGLRKSDPELKAMFDKAISEAKLDGTIEKLSMKYFGYDVTPR